MNALDAAREALLRDAPEHSEVVEEATEQRRWWLEQWPDGAPHVLGLLAQDVQEAVHEGADPLWPRCTEATCAEVGRHPVFVEPDLGPDPFWVCTRTGLPVAAVGSLRRV